MAARRRARAGDPRLTVDGVTYLSIFEADVARDLDERGIDPHYEEETLTYTTSHVYTPDFAPRRADGTKVIVETKGYFPLADRRKMLDVIRENPKVEIRMIFQKANTPIRRGSKQTYGGWCDKQGIVWAEGRVPEEWMI